MWVSIQQYFEPVINGMQAVVEDGTARRSKIPGIIMCGKTGTAQNPRMVRTNSVFVAFAPRENPKDSHCSYCRKLWRGRPLGCPYCQFYCRKIFTTA